MTLPSDYAGPPVEFAGPHGVTILNRQGMPASLWRSNLVRARKHLVAGTYGDTWPAHGHALTLADVDALLALIDERITKSRRAS